MKNLTGIALIVGLVAGLGIYHFFLVPDFKTNTTTETVKDTITTVEIIDTVWTVIALPKQPIEPETTVAKNPKKDPEPEKYDSVRTYSGTHYFEYGKFDWDIKTGGTLLGYTFTPTLTIPTTTTTTTTTSVKTHYIYPKGIYAGLSADSQLNWGVNATYVTKDVMIGYGYRPGPVLQPIGTGQIVPVHEVRAAVNLFKLWK